MPFNELVRQDEHESEIGQAKLRVVITVIVNIYIVILFVFTEEKKLYLSLIFLAYSIFLIFSFAWCVLVKLENKRSKKRRLVAMFLDYAAITLGLSVGGESTMPIYAVMVWVTLGYGVRFGSFYLITANLLAIVSLSISTLANNLWELHPFFIITLFLTVSVIPFYALILLARIKSFSEQAFLASREKSLLLTQVSHDIKQPIHAMNLLISLLKSEKDQRKMFSIADDINETASVISRTFNSILDLHTFNDLNYKYRPEKVKLKQLIDSIIYQFRDTPSSKSSSIYTENVEYSVFVDPVLFGRVISNGLSNAIKYSNGGIVTIIAFEKKNEITLVIKDSGRGISKENLKKVFDEFFRVNDTTNENTDGVGLGLSIVKKIAKISNQKIELYSIEGVGTCFSVSNIIISKQN